MKIYSSIHVTFQTLQTYVTCLNIVFVFSDANLLKLKEKLPQAFMQIEWMENDFRNLTAASLGKFG